uniref:Acetyl-CoA carboxylase carboxyltransferase beta subunit n=1 Tax=Pedicularis longiflora TaxID=326831 RepID=A0A6G7SDE1_9LAMI|nr:acetyl-CoA carboxylase carboxyltransferase beta subunit [Pedicularis longiflora]QIJ99813.1 acetyl-CoA carboxylase carboxyltransferase beta subunit [Pedicularis longiflora]
MVFKKELKRKYDIKKSMDNLGPIENTSESEYPNRKGRARNIHSWWSHDNSSYSKVSCLFAVKDIRNFISDETFLVRDSNGDSFSIYFDIETHIFEIANHRSFLSELESSFSSYRNFSYMNSGSTGEDSLYNHYMYDTQSSWNNHITSCIDSYLQSQICVDTPIVSDSSDSYISECVFDKGRTSSESGRSSLQTRAKSSDLTLTESPNDLDATKKYKHLWVQCENCYALNYKKFLKSKICEQCGYHFQMSSSERIEVLIDPGTWDPMDEDMISLDPIGFHSAEELYKDRYDYQANKKLLYVSILTSPTTGGITASFGMLKLLCIKLLEISLKSKICEQISFSNEYFRNEVLIDPGTWDPMDEDMISLDPIGFHSAEELYKDRYDYQANKKLLYVSILTSPTTGGITASFGMLGDIIIAEPNSYIAFAGKRVIEQTLNKTVPEDSQAAEYLFHKGLFDLIVPRNLLKSVLIELFKFHAFFPLNSNSIK